jgi:hypothetical protein
MQFVFSEFNASSFASVHLFQLAKTSFIQFLEQSISGCEKNNIMDSIVSKEYVFV